MRTGPAALRRRRPPLRALVRALPALLPLVLLAPAAARANTGLPRLSIPRAGGEIRLDGKLSETAWEEATAVRRFYETEPRENAPPPVETTARIFHDGEHLYVSIDARDPHPGRIRASYSRRDRIPETDDTVTIYLDASGARRSAVLFRVNPRGAQADGLWNDPFFSEDLSPGFFWQAAAAVTESGWTAELRIPFSSLRYEESEPGSWGLLVRRIYPRDFRYALHSSPIPRGSNCLLCHMRPLGGLEDLPETWHLTVAPYARVGAREEREPQAGGGTDLEDQPLDADAGFDLQWAPAADHVFDLTVNPDFSQVEPDVAQIRENERFALFFPELRPFFLERADLLETPIRLIHTRTITSPRWGARATGREGDNTYTLLTAEDRGGGSVILPGPTASDLAEQDFESYATVGRLRHDLRSGFLGLTVSDREIRGGGFNRVLAPEFHWRPSGSDQVTGQLAYAFTETPDRPDLTPQWDGRGLSGGALNLHWQHRTAAVQWSGQYRDVSREFRAYNGFVRQVGIREGQGSVGYNFYPEGPVHQIRPRVSGQYTVDRSGREVSHFVVPGVFFLGARNTVGILELNQGGVRVGDEVLDRTNVFFFLQMDPFRRFARFNVNGNLGEEIDFANGRVGDGGRLSVSTELRPTDRLGFELIWNRSWLDVEDESGREGRLFTARTLRLKTTYAFGPRLFLRAIGEWVETERDPSLFRFPVAEREGSFDWSLLLLYELDWRTAVSLGVGEGRTLEAGGGTRLRDRSLFFKVSYAFQL